MQVKGIIEKILPVQSGEGANGRWVRQDAVINQGGQYPKSVCITFFGTKCTLDNSYVGDEVEIEINLESREYNDRYYTSANAWKLKTITPSGAAPESNIPQTERSVAPPAMPVATEVMEADDLPF